MKKRIPVRFRWPSDCRGYGKRKFSCYVEPIETFSALTAKHGGDSTADCSNGVVEMEVRAVLTCPSLKIKEATAKGYAEAKVGDGVNLSNPNSNTRRGRVGDSVVNTLTCDNQMGVVVNDLPLAYDEQNYNLRKDGTVGTLTTDGSSPKHNNRVIVGGV